MFQQKLPWVLYLGGHRATFLVLVGPRLLCHTPERTSRAISHLHNVMNFLKVQHPQ